jgi:DNA-binding Xre family transcriptional regulator
MSSQIDPTVIQDDQKVDKADLREQFGIARDEISALQASTSIIRQLATNDTLWTTL